MSFKKFISPNTNLTKLVILPCKSVSDRISNPNNINHSCNPFTTGPQESVKTHHISYKENYTLYLKKMVNNFCELSPSLIIILKNTCLDSHNDLPNKSMTLKQNSMQKLKK